MKIKKIIKRQKEKIQKKVKYVKYKFYKDKEKEHLKKRIQEKVTEKEAKTERDKTNYDIYEFLEKRKNKCQNQEIIEKKKIQTY